jgi:PAT family beta-lactamase induction signal transducer AmpG
LSATYAWLGKILKGFSGQIVDTLALGRNLMDAYALFFAGAAAIGLPALILCLVLAQVKKPGLSPSSQKN